MIVILYVNIGVKRSIRTSGIQPNISNVSTVVFRGNKWKIHITFPLYFGGFPLYILYKNWYPEETLPDVLER